MGDFTKLKVWQEAHRLTLKAYQLTGKLPEGETYVLKPQLRRAAISYESNIAEGETRYTNPSKLNFFIDSRSSGAEIQTQLMVVRDVYKKLAPEASELISEYESLSKQLNSLISYRRKNPTAQSPNNLIT